MDYVERDKVISAIKHADEDDLTIIIEAVQHHRRVLASRRARKVEVGAWVTLTGLSPKTLNGLQGEIVSITRIGKIPRADVRLSEKSTRSLRYHPQNRRWFFDITSLPDKRYRLGGVPLTCCEVLFEPKPTATARPAADEIKAFIEAVEAIRSDSSSDG